MNKWISALAVVMAGVGLTACDDDNDVVNPADKYVDALEALYPGVAQTASWESRRDYMVAEFSALNAEDREVWLKKGDASWAMTVTDGIGFAALPEVVQGAFAAGEYATWTIDDVDYYERPDLNFYVVEVEKAGNHDTDLYYSPDGSLIKAERETGADIYPDTKI